MKIALTTSPGHGETVLNCNPKYVLKDFIRYPPLAILSIIRGIAPEHDIDIFDANELGYEELLAAIVSARPDLLGISVVTERLYGVLKLARDVKRESPGTRIIIGGPHTDLYPDETMTHPEFDYMLLGPAELTFPAFVHWLAGGRDGEPPVHNLRYRDASGAVRRTETSCVKSLEGFPLPDRKRIDIKKYVSVSDRSLMTTMSSSRGCPFRCMFCNVPRYYLQGTAERIVSEIEEILALGFDEIYILDDTFNISHQRVKEVCGMIIRRGLRFKWSTRARLNPFDDEMAALMKEAGCFRLAVGVESHDPKILKEIGKGVSYEDILRGFEIIHKNRFETTAYFIIGFPGQTLEQAAQVWPFIKTIRPTFLLMNSLIALPFSNLYFDLIKRGVYEKDHWREFVLNPSFEYMLPSWRGERLDQEFMDLRDTIMRDFYLSPSFVLREFARDVAHLDFGKLGRKVGMGVKMLRGTLGRSH